MSPDEPGNAVYIIYGYYPGLMSPHTPECRSLRELFLVQHVSIKRQGVAYIISTPEALHEKEKMIRNGLNNVYNQIIQLKAKRGTE